MSCHPTLCGMLVEVDEDQLLNVKGDPDNPDSQAWLSVHTRASLERDLRQPEQAAAPVGSGQAQRAIFVEPAGTKRWVASHQRWRQARRKQRPFWPGPGTFTTNFGTRISAQLLARLANFHGCQFWNPTMLCWGLGAYGLGLTGMPETHTKEDMGQHANLILRWGANLVSQPNTARHVLAAKRRGAHVVTIDVRHSEAAAKSDEVLIIRPGTDTALALALIHVICGEGLHDAAFVARHTVGFDPLRDPVRSFTPDWAASITGLSAERIGALARRYASTAPARSCWAAARCTRATTVGRPGAPLHACPD